MSKKPSRRTLRFYSEPMSDAEYNRHLKAHQRRIDEEVETLIKRLFRDDEKASVLARAAFLSPSTIRRYQQRKEGRRGPLHKTVVAMRIARGG